VIGPKAVPTLVNLGAALRSGELAIGFITSDPTPVSHRVGTRLARTAAHPRTSQPP
jgi:hypothetical protein